MTPFTGDLILASASQSRRHLLESAGVTIRIMASGVDETAIKRDHALLDAGFDHLAVQLAIHKALAIASRHPDDLVIGADQILVHHGQPFDKPGSVHEARQQLLTLRGTTHSLETAVVCARGDVVLWSHVEAPHLTMREFSSEYLESYLAAEGDSVMQTVGGYKVEGIGIQLFEHIAGDYFAVLGLPLLPLLTFLRTQGAMAT